MKRRELANLSRFSFSNNKTVSETILPDRFWWVGVAFVDSKDKTAIGHILIDEYV